MDFRTVSAAQLADGGIRLTEPLGTPVAAQGRAAAAVASHWFGGHLRVLESKFVHCKDGPHIDEDCWAISLATAHFRYPSSGPPVGHRHRTPAHPAYLMLLVHPGNDRILDAQAGG